MMDHQVHHEGYTVPGRMLNQQQNDFRSNCRIFVDMKLNHGLQEQGGGAGFTNGTLFILGNSSQVVNNQLLCPYLYG